MVRWKLKEVIAEKKLNMRQVAQRSGVSYSQIKQFCRNPYQDATVRTLDKLAEALDVSYAELIESEHV